MKVGELPLQIRMDPFEVLTGEVIGFSGIPPVHRAGIDGKKVIEAIALFINPHRHAAGTSLVHIFPDLVFKVPPQLVFALQGAHDIVREHAAVTGVLDQGLRKQRERTTSETTRDLAAQASNSSQNARTASGYHADQKSTRLNSSH